jgi:hypothetical protein
MINPRERTCWRLLDHLQALSQRFLPVMIDCMGYSSS